MSAESSFPGAWEEPEGWEPSHLAAVPGPSPSSDAASPDSASAARDCWRCGKSFPASQEECPFCRARIRSSAPVVARRFRRQSGTSFAPLVKVVIFFGIMLVLSLILGLIDRFGLDRHAAPPRQVEFYWMSLVLAEAVDTMLVGIALAWIGRPQPLPPRRAATRVLTWASGAPILLVLFGLGIGYHHVLQGFLKLTELTDPVVVAKGLSIGVWLAYCVQPALVEETFFRYLALGCLRETVGTHGAVWLSAVMFGMAHVYNPLGIPYLIVVGAALGYLRVASRGLALPMMLHFGHNAAVLLLEAL